MVLQNQKPFKSNKMNHIKNLLIISALLLFSCSGEDEISQQTIEFYDSPSPYTYGWVKAIKNGQYWEAHPRASDQSTLDQQNNTFGLIFLFFNKKGIPRQKLSILFIPKKTGLYDVLTQSDIVERGSTINARYTTIVADGDVTGEGYRLDESVTNVVTVDSFNEGTGEVTGNFNLSFIIEEEYDRDPEKPDYITFENGEFYAKLNYDANSD